MLFSLPAFSPHQTTSISVLNFNRRRHPEAQRPHGSPEGITSLRTRGSGAWRIHRLPFPSPFPLRPTAGCPSLSECFPMGNCSRISFSHPWVPIVCPAALGLAANQSQRLSYTNKQGIVASPRAGTQEPNKQFSQVIAGWTNRQSIAQTPSCLRAPNPFFSTVLTTAFSVQERVYRWALARGRRGC